MGFLLLVAANYNLVSGNVFCLRLIQDIWYHIGTVPVHGGTRLGLVLLTPFAC